MRRFWIAVAVAACAGAAARAEITAVQAQVNGIIPALGDANAELRHEPRMKLQSMAAEASKPGAEAARIELEQAMVARIADDKVSQPARVWMVRQLETIGGAGSVPVLTRLLADADPELRETARRALEVNPASAAALSLRNALKSGGDVAWRIGLVHSIGRRADAASVEMLVPLLGDADVGPAAVNALARMATPAATEALLAAYDGKSVPVGAALLDAALRQGEGGRAILARLIPQGNPPSLRAGSVAAMIGRSAPAEAPRWIAAGLADPDARIRCAASRAGAAHAGPGLTASLAGSWEKLGPGGRALALDLMDAGGRQLAVDALGGADPDVAEAGVRLLVRLGGADGIPALLGAAASDRPVRSAAEQGLALLKGDGVATALQKAAAEGEYKRRAAAIAVLAMRREPASMATLVASATDPDPGVARAALVALRQAGGDAEIPAVAKVAAQGKADARAALKAMAARTRDRRGVSQTLVNAIRAADAPGRAALLESLAAVGGLPALDMTAEFAASADAALRAAAVRALAEWIEFEAVRPLQAIAAAPASSLSEKTLAVRGIARLVTSGLGATVDQRITAATEAMRLAPGDDERKLLLPALGSIPHPRSLAALEPLLEDRKLSREAAFALAALAEACAKTDRRMAASIAERLEKSTAPDAAKKKAREAVK
ncbi:MAG: hypothetical protein FJ221_05345 [Lentisphaerae bacterium]|nr:hypothetical protein [Lentisphaerota bacterium]